MADNRSRPCRQPLRSQCTYRHTRSATPIDDGMQMVAREAEAGYDVDEIIARRGKCGRPVHLPMGHDL